MTDDLISRQAAIEALNINRNPVFHDSVDYEGAMYDICKLPSGLVRCGECIYHIDEEPGMVYCDHVIGGWIKEDAFCADGERREDDAEIH